MSNHLAIATVTAALQRTLQASVQRDVEGVRISTVAPHRVGQGIPETGINLFLYHITRNNALKSPDSTVARSRNKQSPWRHSVLELHYLLSFYGNEAELEPQRLLGSTVRTFNDCTSLSPVLIQDTLSDSTFTFLGLSNLANQVQELQIIPEDLSLEDLSKLWSVFVQTPYSLSIAYKVMAVVIDGEEPSQQALPVRDRPIHGISPFLSRPQIDQVMAEGGRMQLILPDSTLLIQGRQLQGIYTQVRIGGLDVVPREVSSTQLLLPLATVAPQALRAGVQSLQVVQRAAMTFPGHDANAPQPCVVSNPAPFSLCPVIKSIHVSQLDMVDEEHCSAVLQLEVSPRIAPEQIVLFSLYEWSVSQPATFLVDVPPRSHETSELTVVLRLIKPGEYLVRIVVDGAESPLGVDLDPDSPTYNWFDSPRVVLRTES
ncbi:DUF4255 domain-containing protein [Leptolyngbya sp. AN02str]|uniref:DUF4255 domain-containing protein n=1 Tax=Leptolyngbya sp. AN02str TaxID=3423363 RepID=UPI003D30FB0C